MLSYVDTSQFSISVITPTRRRVRLLERAMNSVKNQDFAGEIEHLILIDDCKETQCFMENGSSQTRPNVRHLYLSRSCTESSGPSRVAKLRNFGTSMAAFEWIAFLDDDNEFEPDHLAKLIDVVRKTGCQAAHSQSLLFYSDGRPYLEQRIPWYRDHEQGKAMYKEFALRGIVTPGSNVIRSRFPDAIISNSDTNFVDTSEWLIRRELLIKYPFVENYDLDDWTNIVTEDDKLVYTFSKHNISVGCTGNPTVKYYLGGYSNSKLELQRPGQWVIE